MNNKVEIAVSEIVEQSLLRIAESLESISQDGLDICCHIRFPDDTDKFALDLASMKINEGLETVGDAINNIGEAFNNFCEEFENARSEKSVAD